MILWLYIFHTSRSSLNITIHIFSLYIQIQGLVQFFAILKYKILQKHEPKIYRLCLQFSKMNIPLIFYKVFFIFINHSRSMSIWLEIILPVFLISSSYYVLFKYLYLLGSLIFYNLLFKVVFFFNFSTALSVKL